MLYQDDVLLKEHRSEVSRLFKSKVLSYLQPVFIGATNHSRFSHKLPFLQSRTLYFAIILRSKSSSKTVASSDQASEEISFAYLNIPSTQLSRFVELSPVKEYTYFIFLDDIIRANLSVVFPGYEVMGCFSFKLNRAEDISIEDEYEGNLVQKIKIQLDKRKSGPPIRFLYDGHTPPKLLDLFTRIFDLQEDDLVPGGRYHNLNDLMKLSVASKPGLKPPSFPALSIPALEECESLFAAIEQQDRLIHFPYQSYDYVLRFFNEAAIDPLVYEIKVTLYRIASDSLIANALISAAKNGKKVTVFVEVKARFDEANNLRWAEEMENAGIHIMYSLPGLKVHAKVALVKRRDPSGQPGAKPKGYAYFGTGNFNEVTAGIYADHGLFTRHRGMIKDLEKIFRYLKKQKNVRHLSHLLVAPFNLQQRYLAMIDREIDFVQQGKAASLIIKLNGLEDKVMIDKLYEASRAGVKINLVIRGICCLVPGVKGMSENIRVIRLVDQFLEHARVAIFGNGGNEEIFLASADWMNRNLYRRIEVGFPIYDPLVKADIRQIIDFQLQDNVKACTIDQQQANIPIQSKSKAAVRAQANTYAWLKEKGL